MRVDLCETGLKGRVYDKNPVMRKSIKSTNLTPDEIYNSNLLHQMRRASGRS